jgi:hypothetical protein
MTVRKRGRPRKFNKAVFIDRLYDGLSRRKACDELTVSYKTLEYHLRKDRCFKGQVREAEEHMGGSKRNRERFEKKWKNLIGLWSDSDSIYFKALGGDFISYILYMSKLNVKEWGPIGTKIVDWYKWADPMERKIFMIIFIGLRERQIGKKARQMQGELDQIFAFHGGNPPLHRYKHLSDQCLEEMRSRNLNKPPELLSYPDLFERIKNLAAEYKEELKEHDPNSFAYKIDNFKHKYYIRSFIFR